MIEIRLYLVDAIMGDVFIREWQKEKTQEEQIQIFTIWGDFLTFGGINNFEVLMVLPAKFTYDLTKYKISGYYVLVIGKVNSPNDTKKLTIVTKTNFDIEDLMLFLTRGKSVCFTIDVCYLDSDKSPMNFLLEYYNTTLKMEFESLTSFI